MADSHAIAPLGYSYWSPPRDRRNRAPRRENDRAWSQPVGPSAAFLAQVVNQMRPAAYAPSGAYAGPRLRCGVCVDERA